MNKNNQLDRIEKLVEELANYSMQEFSNFREEMKIVKEEIKDLGRNQRSMKLDLLDKLASKERVDNHELRIQELESQLA